MPPEIIGINLVGLELEAQYDYCKTSPNQRNRSSNHLISFTSVACGVFEAEGRGEGLKDGDTLYFSLKGSKGLILPLKVESLRYLIEPSDQWQASLKGDAFESLSIFTWQVQCNSCEHQEPLEFACRSGDSQENQVFHAETRLKALGWSVTSGKHLCPTCRKQLN